MTTASRGADPQPTCPPFALRIQANAGVPCQVEHLSWDNTLVPQMNRENRRGLFDNRFSVCKVVNMNRRETSTKSGKAGQPATKFGVTRTVHLIDLENVVGSGHVTEWGARQSREAYLASGVVARGDHVIVAVSHHNLLSAGYGWPDARRVVRSGQDGADLALQDVMSNENLPMRFGNCIVVTGDGGFAGAVAAMIRTGLPVGVIAPAGRLSAALKLAAAASRELDFTTATPQTSWSA